jgi:hypothetical protein
MMEHIQEETPDIAHLTFTQKSKCGGKGVRISLQSSIHTKGNLGKKGKRESDVSSVLLKEKE